MDAELVLEGRARDVVLRAQAAVLIDQELGHQEERDAARALGRVRKPREDEVDHVLRDVVVAPGDEDLLAADQVVVTFRHRARAHGREVRSRLRLGEIHRAGPLAGDELRQIPRLLLRRAVRLERLHRAHGEQGAQRERHVGRIPHLDRGGEHERGESLAAVLRIAAEAVPSAFDELAIGGTEAVRRNHAVLAEARALCIAGLVERGEDFGRQLRGLLEHRIDELGVASSKPGRDCRRPSPASSFITKRMSRTGAR